MLLTSLFGPATGYAQTVPVLLSVTELKALLGSSEPVLVLDVRPVMYFLMGHLPNARQVWRPEYEAEDGDYPFGGMRASRNRMERLLSRQGATRRTHIVVYDEREGLDAARFWWLLKLYGHDKVSLLNGGISAWKKQGQAVRMGARSLPKPSQYRFQGKAHPEYLAGLEQVQHRSGNTVVLDVRSYDEFSGKTRKSGAYRKGRIPGSIWLEYNASLGKDGFLPIEKLKQLFAEHNVTPDKTVIVYCQSGVRSAHTHFVLTQLLGFSHVENYDGSWIEWSWNRQLSIDKGPESSVSASKSPPQKASADKK